MEPKQKNNKNKTQKNQKNKAKNKNGTFKASSMK